MSELSFRYPNKKIKCPALAHAASDVNAYAFSLENRVQSLAFQNFEISNARSNLVPSDRADYAAP